MSFGAASASAFSASASLLRSVSPFEFGWKDCETFAASPSRFLQFLADANDVESEPDVVVAAVGVLVAVVVVPVAAFLLPHPAATAINSTPSTTVTPALLRISCASCPVFCKNLRRRARRGKRETPT